jgi:nitrate/nitrite transport system permease protein
MKSKIIKFFSIIGFRLGVRLVKIVTGEDVKEQVIQLKNNLLLPVAAIVAFLMLWGIVARQIHTSLGVLPGPVEVYGQVKSLLSEHREERMKEKAFYDRQKKRNDALIKQKPDADVKTRAYTGKPTYIDQILTSLKTVFLGFLIASLIAIPIGILCGVSRSIMAAMSPLIQIFKPVSPLAWLPIVTMVVSAVYITKEGFVQKSFIISAITVSLCSLWPSLINTATGVANIDNDYLNVGKVLKLGFFTRIYKIIIPSSLPMIFTGLRISLGVGWMVLIASEMLAQNPGLGKFVWDEFQNGSSQSLARIMVAVLTIGIIGALLDRLMTKLQLLVSFNRNLAGV